MELMTTPTKCTECLDSDATSGGLLCSSCQYWLLRVARRDDMLSVRAAGVQYWVGREGPTAKPTELGSGGQRYVIFFADGRIIETVSLWVNGEIPERFRARLPDNAEPPKLQP